MVVTFVPFPNLEKIASVLDKKRYNKQITECIELVNALEGTKQGYSKHPATLMWKGHIEALKFYYNFLLAKWYEFGGKGSRKPYEIAEEEVSWPWWWGLESVHLSHKLSLRRKNPEHYTMELLELTEKQESLMPLVGYVWPSKVYEKYQGDIELISQLSISTLCDPIGQGAPVHYLWKVDEVQKWTQNRTKNPRTGRTISRTSKTGIYSQLEKAEAYYRLHGKM